MTNIVDISGRLPPPKFTPRISDHSRVEAYASDPAEWQITNLSHALLMCLQQIALVGGIERMHLEASVALDIATNNARRA